jgi:Domain of unknown function (DUF4150)
MSNEVFANGMEIACKSGDGKVIAAFPDVCLSPPSPPAGPVPVPYPDTSFSKDMKNGSKTVKIDGKEVMLKDQSFYKTSPLGNEAATRSFGAGVVSHVITGKTYFIAWSMDIKFEGMNVDRHLDLTTSNHASPMGDTPPSTETEGQAAGDDEPECPCCHQTPPHANQVDEHGDLYDTIDEDEFYQNIVDNRQAKIDSIETDITEGKDYTKDPDKLKRVRELCQKQLEEAKAAKAVIDAARNIDPPCPNVYNPANEGCGTHFKMTRSLDSLVPEEIAGKSKRKKYYRETILQFNNSVKQASERKWNPMGKSKKGTKYN